MKKLIVTLTLVIGLTLVSQAQSTNPLTGANKGVKNKNHSPEEKAKHMADRAAKELSLTPDQKTKWEAAELERIKANVPLQEKMKGSTTPEERKSLHSQAQANKDKFETTVNGFLTPEQKAQFDNIKRRHHGKGKRKE
jgi:Spy/CpxP family protein refolding chaperone